MENDDFFFDSMPHYEEGGQCWCSSSSKWSMDRPLFPDSEHMCVSLPDSYLPRINVQVRLTLIDWQQMLELSFENHWELKFSLLLHCMELYWLAPKGLWLCCGKGTVSSTTIKFNYSATCYSVEFRIKSVFIIGSKRRALWHSTFI